jgi:hypothetical protein
LARQPPYFYYQTCQVRRGRRSDDHGHRWPCLKANAQALFAYPDGSEAEGGRSSR